jgi:hypothetical protein
METFVGEGGPVYLPYSDPNQEFKQPLEPNGQVLHLDKKSGYRPPTPLHKALSRPKPEVIVPVMEAPKPAPMKMEVAPKKVEAPAPIVPEVKAPVPVIPEVKPEVPKVEEPYVPPPVIPEVDPTPPVVDPQAPNDILLPYSDLNEKIEKPNEPVAQILHIDAKPNFKPPAPVQAPVQAPEPVVVPTPMPEPIVVEEAPQKVEAIVPEIPVIKEEQPMKKITEESETPLIPTKIPEPAPVVIDPLAPKDILLPYSDNN